jgi:hypothetical protein
MVRDNVTFRFRIDMSQMTVKGREAIAILDELQRKSNSTGASVTKLGNDTKITGDKMVSASVNFQTATQGMLNLSTAAVQTFTSISNLDRAANRAAQAKLGMARATDLLNNKELRLNDLQQKGLGTSTKAAILTNEIATARADLAIKTDKARIEEGAMLDIQMLFVANIANVMISSLTTIKTLRDLNTLATIRATIAENGYIMKLKGLIIAQKMQIMTSKGVITVTKGMTFSVKGLTLSVRGLMIALGPIALLIGGITIAMQAYEENWGGLKDKLQGALPFLKETNSDLDEAATILENDRVNLGGYNDELDRLTGKLNAISEPHKNYLKMMAEASIKLGNNKDLAKQYADQLVRIRTEGGSGGFSAPSVGGGQPTVSGVQGVSSTFGDRETQTVPSQIIQEQTTVQNIISLGRREKKISKQATPSEFKFAGATGIGAFGGESLDMSPHPFGTDRQKKIFRFLPKEEQLKLTIDLMKLYNEGGSVEMVFAASSLIDTIQSTPDKPKIKSIEEELKNILDEDAGFFADESVLAISKIRKVGAKDQEFRFGIDIAERRGIDADSNRGIVLNKTGIDIGPIGDLVDVNEGIRLANLETTLSQFRNTTGGKTDSLLSSIHEAGRTFRQEALRDEMTGKGSFGGRSFFKSTGATAAYQVPRGSIRTSAENRRRLDIRDANTNRLRFGGRLREGMTIEEEGAVVGGYSDPQAFSRAMKEQRLRLYETGQLYAASFGILADSSIMRGRSSRRIELGRVTSASVSIKNALASAGLGFKNVGYLDYGYKATAAQASRAIAEHSAAVSYNNNQYAKATQINILEGGFGLGGFRGTSMDLPSLQDKVSQQDDLMKSIGLSRTEAFQIVDTKGRGREEIDDRLKWKSRLNSISTGTAVL